MMTKYIIVFVIAFGLSGCVVTSANEETGPRAPEDPFANRNQFIITGCSGLLYETPWIGPEPTGQAPKPDGWGNLISETQYDIIGELLGCGRLAWGPLERGSTWFGWESHDGYIAPDACTEDIEGFVLHHTLNHIFSDDPDVIDHARSLHMPASLSTFNVTDGTASSKALAWQAEGNGQSRVEAVLAGQKSGTIDRTIALFWLDEEDHLYRLSLAREGIASRISYVPAEFNPPSLLSERPPPHLTRSTWTTTTNWIGELSIFDSPSCEKRIDS